MCVTVTRIPQLLLLQWRPEAMYLIPFTTVANILDPNQPHSPTHLEADSAVKCHRISHVDSAPSK